MIVLKPKNRILTLRLSEDDYHVLRQASVRDGARCLSDYARDSLFHTARVPPAVVHDLKARMTEFEVEMELLSDAVRRLQSQVCQEKAAGQ